MSWTHLFWARQCLDSKPGHVEPHAGHLTKEIRPVEDNACAQTQATAASTRLGGAVCSALGGIAIAAVATSVRAGRRRGAYAGRAKVVTLHAAADPTAAAVKVGDAIPNIGLDKGFPPEKVMLADYCKGKKVVLVGLPGAFTPT
jgi:hypothetical protein